MSKHSEILNSFSEKLQAYQSAKEARAQQLAALRQSYAAAIASKDAAASAGDASAFDSALREVEYLAARILAVTAEKDAPLFQSVEDAAKAASDYMQAAKDTAAPIYAEMLTSWEAIAANLRKLEGMEADAAPVMQAMREHFAVYKYGAPAYGCPFNEDDSVYRFAAVLQSEAVG